jgi:hypothetical protein
MNDISLTLPAEHVSQRLFPGAGALFATLRSASIYLAFVSSVGFTLAMVLGILN